MVPLLTRPAAPRPATSASTSPSKPMRPQRDRDVWEQERSALGMAAQLAHLVVGDILQGVPAIAGGQGIGHVRLGLAGLFQHLSNGPLRQAF